MKKTAQRVISATLAVCMMTTVAPVSAIASGEIISKNGAVAYEDETAPAASAFDTSALEAVRKVYDGTSIAPTVRPIDTTTYEYEKTVYLYTNKNAGIFDQELQDGELPTNAGVYKVKTWVKNKVTGNEWLVTDASWTSTIERENIDFSKFHATFDGKTVLRTDVPEFAVKASDVEDELYKRFVVTYDGEDDIHSTSLYGAIFTENGTTELDPTGEDGAKYFEKISDDEDGYILKPGVYRFELYFMGSKNLKGQTLNGDHSYPEAVYKCKATIVSDQSPDADDFQVETDKLTYTGKAQGLNIKPTESGKYVISAVKYYSDRDCTKEVTPIDAGDYYAKLTVAGHEDADIVLAFSIQPADVTADDFTFVYKGQTVTSEISDVAGESELGNMEITYNPTGEKFTMGGNFAGKVADSNGNDAEPTEPGTYEFTLTLDFNGTKNLNPKEKLVTWKYIYTVPSKDVITKIDPENPEQTEGVTKTDDGEGIKLQKGYTLELDEDTVIEKPVQNEGTIKSGTYAAPVTKGEEESTVSGGTFLASVEATNVSGGTFADKVKADTVSGGVFAEKPNVMIPIDDNKMDTLTIENAEGGYVINNAIGANNAATMALFAENSAENDTAAYIVGENQSIRIQYVGPNAENFKRWEVVSGGVELNGSDDTAAFSTSATGKTITLKAVFKDTTLEQPETKTYKAAKLEDGVSLTVNGKVYDDKTGIKAGDELTLTLDTSFIDQNEVFETWSLSEELEKALLAKDSTFNLNQNPLTFTIPKDFEMEGTELSFKAKTTLSELAGESDHSALGIATGVVGGTVVAGILGWQAYSLVSQSYLELNLPYIPTNRQELATLLWEDAGKPELAVEVYADIDADKTELQKAARWAVAEGLMDEADDEQVFTPNNGVSKWTIIKAWRKAQKLKKQ